MVYLFDYNLKKERLWIASLSNNAIFFSDTRRQEVFNGTCHVGVCLGETACKTLSSTTYTCLCTHTKLPPSENGDCTRRIGKSLYTIKPKLHNLCPNMYDSYTLRPETVIYQNGCWFFTFSTKKMDLQMF